MAICAASERTRCHQLHSENYDPLVESGQMTLLKGGEEIVPGHFGEDFSRAHGAHAGDVIRARQNPHLSQKTREVGHPERPTLAISPI